MTETLSSSLLGGGKRKRRITVARRPRRKTLARRPRRQHVRTKKRSSRDRKGGFDSGVLVPAALLGALQLYKRRSSNKSSKKMSRRIRRR